jgi:DNA-binding CsgD family transcriptional regulator
MHMTNETADRRALELAVWKMSRGGLPDQLIADALRISRRDLSGLRGQRTATNAH